MRMYSNMGMVVAAAAAMIAAPAMLEALRVAEKEIARLYIRMGGYDNGPDLEKIRAAIAAATEGGAG